MWILEKRLLPARTAQGYYIKTLQDITVFQPLCLPTHYSYGVSTAIGGKSIVASENVKGCEAVVVVGLVESCSAVISNEFLDHFRSDIGIGAKSDEG